MVILISDWSPSRKSGVGDRTLSLNRASSQRYVTKLLFADLQMNRTISDSNSTNRKFIESFWYIVIVLRLFVKVLVIENETRYFKNSENLFFPLSKKLFHNLDLEIGVEFLFP